MFSINNNHYVWQQQRSHSALSVAFTFEVWTVFYIDCVWLIQMKLWWIERERKKDKMIPFWNEKNWMVFGLVISTEVIIFKGIWAKLFDIIKKKCEKNRLFPDISSFSLIIRNVFGFPSNLSEWNWGENNSWDNEQKRIKLKKRGFLINLLVYAFSTWTFEEWMCRRSSSCFYWC